MTHFLNNMIQILISAVLTLPPKGIVITTITSNFSDSCRTTIRLENNKDTIVWFPKNKCPEIRSVISI